eukprot:4059627-Alexandrium_andersonii.AAC.1
MELAALQKAIKEAAPDSAKDMNNIIAFVKSMGEQSLSRLQELGCTVYYHRHTSPQLYFVPTGWVVCERVVAGPL